MKPNEFLSQKLADLLPQPLATKQFAYLQLQYAEPHRRYHTFQHLYEMFVLADEFESLMGQPKLVALAIFYHDFVYDVRASDNEARSAAIAETVMNNLLSNEELLTLHRLIVATQKHQVPSDTPKKELNDLNLFLDLDLAILGASPERYAEYSAQIREEYSLYSDDAYNAGRKQVLQNFTSMSSIYKTEVFRDRFEKQAFINLKQELAKL